MEPIRQTSVTGKNLLVLAAILVLAFATILGFVLTRPSENPVSAVKTTPIATACGTKTETQMEVTACAYGPQTLKVSVASNGYIVVQGILTPGNSTLPMRLDNAKMRIIGAIDAKFGYSGQAPGHDMIITGAWRIVNKSAHVSGNDLNGDAAAHFSGPLIVLKNA
jgi:hypothetical protein